MPSPNPISVQSDSDLPDRVDTVIIGGGIAGLATGLELAEQGQSVAVFEKGIVAGEQSGRNWGWCRQMGRDSREIPLSKISLNLWRNMDSRLGAATGFTECGIAYLCETDEQLEKRVQWYEEQAIPHELTTRVISTHQAHNISAGCSIAWKGGLLTPDDGRAEPQLAVPAMAQGLQRLGGTIHQSCAVRTLETKAGMVSGVVTERGQVRCSNVVLAGGVWSHRFLRNMGVRLPQLTVRNSVMRTTPVEADLPHSLFGAGIALRKRQDGGFTVAEGDHNTADIIPDSFRYLFDFLPVLKSDWRDFKFRFGHRFVEEARHASGWAGDEITPFENARRLDPRPDMQLLQRAERSLREMFPDFKGVGIVDRWAGAIDVVPDVIPVISPLDKVPGFFIATGFSGHGFGLGPGAGQLMAEIILGKKTCVDPTPFKFDRFG